MESFYSIQFKIFYFPVISSIGQREGDVLKESSSFCRIHGHSKHNDHRNINKVLGRGGLAKKPLSIFSRTWSGD